MIEKPLSIPQNQWVNQDDKTIRFQTAKIRLTFQNIVDCHIKKNPYFGLVK